MSRVLASSGVVGHDGGAGGHSGKMLAPVTPVNPATTWARKFVAA